MKEYEKLCHAMQTGVAMKMHYDPTDASPKHLRVGVNSALCDSAALARLLISKGVFTEAEYEQAITDEMRREVARYKEELINRFGVRVELL